MPYRALGHHTAGHVSNDRVGLSIGRSIDLAVALSGQAASATVLTDAETDLTAAKTDLAASATDLTGVATGLAAVATDQLHVRERTVSSEGDVVGVQHHAATLEGIRLWKEETIPGLNSGHTVSDCSHSAWRDL